MRRWEGSFEFGEDLRACVNDLLNRMTEPGRVLTCHYMATTKGWYFVAEEKEAATHMQEYGPNGVKEHAFFEAVDMEKAAQIYNLKEII